MSDNIKLYTILPMEQAVVDSATSEATGFPKENLIDNNPDTYWKSTSTANQTIDMDLQSAFSLTSICIFVQNYASISAGIFYKYYSDNGSEWTGLGGGVPLGAQTAGPLRINVFGASSHRYWRIIIQSLAEVPQISGIWWGKEYNLGQGDNWPENDKDTFNNIIIKGQAGRTHRIARNKRRNFTTPRRYVFSDSATFEKLRDAYNDSRGDLWPLIIQEGSAYSDARLVHFADKSLAHNQIKDALYRPSVQFADIPYIHDGDSY